MAEAKKNLQGSTIIAKLFGVTDRRVQQLAKEGIIPAAQTRPYKFDLLPTVQAYIKHLSEKANGREQKSNDVAQAEADRVRAEADIKQAKAKIAEMQLKEMEGSMHRSEDVKAMTTDLVFTIRGMIMALPGRLAMDVAQVSNPAEVSVLIRDECYKILEELSAYKYDPEAYQQRVREREGWSENLIDETDE